MTPCERLSQRMPAAARGASRWSDEDERHLAACEACAAEWRLVRAARGLGAEVEEELDPGPIAEAVLARLRAAPAAERRRRWRWAAWSGAGLAAAAALALLLWPGSGQKEASPAPVAQLVIQLPELEDLSVAELEDVLQSIDPALQGTPILVPGLGDLNAQELERVLSSLEG